MGLFGGSSSASSSSTNNSYTWNSQQIENFLDNMSTDINYTPENFLDANPYMQQFLDYELSPQGFNNANNIIGKGSQIFQQGYSRLQKAAGITPQEIYNGLYNGVKMVNGQMSGYMNQEDQAIQDQVMVGMGGNLAQNAETMNAGGAVAGSSAMNNTAMGIQEAGAESMEEQESELAASILKGSTRAVNNIAGSYAKAQSGITKSILGIGGDVMKGGIKALNNAKSGYWNAAVVEQAIAQKQQDTSRKNAMINNNMGIMENMYWLETMLQAAGIDTTSTTTGSSTVSGGGIL
ncbi:hypothetical protein ZX68_000320 [Salmonella enterica subsp. enterica]|uniref:hypothetical protein n=1 Tax=Salmonella enterica TaxID=28901 RepID=UPI0009739AEE|nr:hypothetical protein [Salmonella enterica]EBE2904025.1 hypothetical protein [Salmonella enterica subsp. enterica serovar Krefeld]EDQ2558346.1 hypothetical protein [Salmonella enterica subsp. enterica serovar Langensalza]APY72374.1 hypothetical protein LFZ24_08500 [Salmonella enterica subsp. enterica serovar Krefeld str. SA20030536]EAY9603174.1 hypothetical protein [Salmonella enterica]EBH8892844.1 hypothetical protein [Salmonella enterica subsp. enterica serovar Krefeld]